MRAGLRRHARRRLGSASVTARAGGDPRRRRVGGGRSRSGRPIVAGRDVGAPPAPRRRWRVRLAPAAIVAAGAVCAALGLVVLRMDAIRLRYELADAIRAEQSLLDQQRRLTLEVRHLRHPLRLEELGRALGLESASCVIDLAAPAPCREHAP